MGKPTGFIEIKRHEPGAQPPAERIRFYKEFEIPLTETEVSKQGARARHALVTELRIRLVDDDHGADGQRGRGHRPL